MAKLTDQLPMVDRGMETQRPVESVSIFEQLARGVSGLLGAEQNAIQVRTRRATAERQARQDALAAADRAAVNDAALRLPEILNPTETDSRTAAAMEAAQAAAANLSPFQAALRQGRVTRDAMELRIESNLRSLLAAHPNSANEIVEFFRQNNLMSPLMREYTEAAEDIRDNQQAYRENEQSLVAYAQNTLGLQVHPDMTTEQFEEVLNAARLHIRARTDLQDAQQQLQHRTAQSNATDQERERALRDYSRQWLTSAQNAAAGELHAFQIAITQLLDDDSISDTDKQQRLTRLLATVTSGARLRLNQYITEGGGNVRPEDVNQLRQIVEGYITGMGEMITGDNGIVQRRVQLLQLMQTNLGINAAQSLPIFSQVRALLGNNATTDAFLTALMQNQQLMGSVRQELQNFQGIGPQEQRVRISNIASIIAGRTGIRDYTPAEARQMLPTIVGTLRNLSTNAAARTGDDPQAHLAGVTALGQISNVAIEATPQWGVRPLYDLINAVFNNPNLTQFLFNTRANTTERLATVNAWIPAATRVVHALKDAPTGDRYFDVVWNSRNSRFEIRRNNTPLRVQSDQSLARFGRLPGFDSPTPRPSEATTMKLNGLNRMITRLMDVSGAGFDQSVPRNTPGRERAEFYATGRPTTQMRQQTQREQQQQPRNSSRETLQRLDELERNVGSWITNMPTAPSAPTDTELDTQHIAQVIIGAESGNDPNARNRQSSATGLGQFTNDTWLDVMQRHFPNETRGKSRAEILALRTNPDLARRATIAHVGDNLNTLRDSPFPANGVNAYVLHFFGPGQQGGGMNFLRALQANPNAPVSDSIVGPGAMAANRNLWTGTGANRRPKTLAEVYQMITNTFNQRAQRFAGREDGGAFAGVQ